MLERLNAILTKTMDNPQYLRYYWQNKHFCRWYFPSVYRFFQTFKKPTSIDLGSESGLARLHVILRTTDAVMNINASRQLECVGISSRQQVISAGGCSLFKAAHRFAERYGCEHIRITLIVDRLSAEGLALYRDAAATYGLSFDVVDAKGHGNGPTFQTQIDIALQDSDDTLALILEDDYLLEEDVLTTCFHIIQGHSHVTGMTPHFHPDRVRRQDAGLLVTLDGRLYCRVKNTCCTFFMPVSQIRRFEKSLRVYDGKEDGSVNVAWHKGICLAPLGWTLAEHLHRTELSPVNRLRGQHVDNRIDR